MPIKRMAFKALRKSDRKHVRNIAVTSQLKTLAKKVEKYIKEKNAAEAKKALNVFSSKMSQAKSKGVIRKNTASRKISRLAKRVASLSKA